MKTTNLEVPVCMLCPLAVRRHPSVRPQLFCHVSTWSLIMEHGARPRPMPVLPHARRLSAYTPYLMCLIDDGVHSTHSMRSACVVPDARLLSPAPHRQRRPFFPQHAARVSSACTPPILYLMVHECSLIERRRLVRGTAAPRVEKG
jgi:hypothetical protein